MVYSAPDQYEKDVLKEISRDKIVNLARELIQTSSLNPPGEEKNIAELIVSRLSNMGIEAELEEVSPGRPNVVAKVAGTIGKPRLVLNGHMDIVPVGEGWTKDPFGGEVVDDKIYGRGSVDMKGALASMMIALDSIKRVGAELKGDLLFHAVVGEEVDGRGTKCLVDRGLKADFAIIGEPTDLDICIAHKGNYTFQVLTYGRAIHASIPHRGVNAILKMVEVIEALKEYERWIKEKVNHPILGGPTLNIGMISGGTKSNIVPDRCRIMVDRRLVPPERLSEVREEVAEVIERVKIRDPQLQCEFKSLVEVEPSEIIGGEEGLNLLKSSIEQVLGKKAVIKGLIATCDAVFMNTIAKIPTVIIGPGSLLQAHTADEYISVDELVSASKIYALTALRFLR